MAFKKPTPAMNEGVNFGSLDMYVAGGGLPEGDYALEFMCQMFQATNQSGVSRGPSRLGVMITAHSLTDAASEPRSQFYSMGSNADKSFAPNPDTGKGLVLVPGGAASTLPQSTNWMIFLKSLYDCGLPEGIFTNDLTVLDGMHVHMSNIPEPEERKGFQSSTGEVQEVRRAATIAVVSEIKDDGKPWEGTGGIGVAAPTPAAKKTTAKPAAKPVAAAPVAEETNDDVKTLAQEAISQVLGKLAPGATMPKLKLRTETFKAAGQDAGAVIIQTYFGSDEALNSVLADLGYMSQGGNIKEVA